MTETESFSQIGFHGEDQLGMNQASRRDEALRARDLIAQAKARGIKGSEREYWVMGQLGWDSRTDPSRLRRLVRSIGAR